MKLSEIMKGVAHRGAWSGDPEVPAIACDSRAVTPGCAFFALPGTKTDGAAYVPDALARGAAVVVAERDVDHGAAVLVLVADAPQALAYAAANFHGRPSRTMAVAGVTGTNGKTTTVYLVEGIAAEAGRTCGVIGTIEYRVAGARRPATHTTPGPLDLQALLAEMKGARVDTVVMEVSSHALAMRRADGIAFDAVAFTNLSRDHLDYHGDMDAYLRAKARLFGPLSPDRKETVAVINVDDPAGRALAGETAYRTVAVSGAAHASADVYPLDCTITIDGIEGAIMVAGTRVPVRSRLIGRHNLMNLAVAAGVAHALGFGAGQIERGIAAVARVPGRLERVDNGTGVACLVDYAHTDDALVNVLTTLKALAPRRIITVFGCGGDRDRGKRPLMGRAAASLSDVVVVTSDNPRTEQPGAIIDEILPGVRAAGKPALATGGLAGAAAGFAVEPDRRAAIAMAAHAAAPGDVLLIAGKGHEDYQIVGTEKRHFDDREEAAAALAAASGKGER